MKDPWRIVDTIRNVSVEADAGKQKISPFEIDFDATLRPEQSCVLRFKTCAIEVHSRDLQSHQDALEVLAQAVIDLKMAKANLFYAFAQRGRTMLRPPPDARTASLECGTATVWFVGVTLDDGALRLVRDLIKFRRDPKLSPIVAKHGILPMLKA